MDTDVNSRQISNLLKRAIEGRDDAYDDVIAMASARLQCLARRMFADFPRLQRWEQTDDVVQNASIRLHRSLAKVRPDSMARFVGLASTEIRRTLIDMARHHFGPAGAAAKHRSGVFAGDPESENVGAHPADVAVGPPERLEAWTQFHEAVGRLPDDEREVVELTWFSGLSQQEIGEMTGQSIRTVKRRWRAAKLRLYDWLGGVNPLAAQD